MDESLLIPKGWRKIHLGERIKKGDFYYVNDNSMRLPYQGLVGSINIFNRLSIRPISWDKKQNELKNVNNDDDIKLKIKKYLDKLK